MTYSTTTHSQAKNIVIIGGGITGLSAAYYLKKEQKATGIPLSITLIEVGDKLGGKIITEKVDGFTIEGGPDCFLRQKPWAAELAEEMGIGEDLIGTNDDKRKVYVLGWCYVDHPNKNYAFCPFSINFLAW
jgi:oxygen-dependent protoporphyrinogen oxidase